MFEMLKPGAKVSHKSIKLNGTVISCINLYDREDRLDQGPRYYVATSVDVWSIPHDSLTLIEQGSGLSDYHRKQYPKYLISGYEMAEFDQNTSLNFGGKGEVATPLVTNKLAPSGGV